MKIVADENIAEVRSFFAELGDVRTMPGREIKNTELTEADMLLVRSVTQVDKALLAGTPVKFVGTCTIGTDHIDRDYLNSRDIGFASAPGCNAEAVVDYVISAITWLMLDLKRSLQNQTVGIVGIGNVGGRLRKRLEAYGVNCICCDPPLARAGVEGLIDLPQLVNEADIISLHTPLTLDGAEATFHLLNSKNLPQLKPGAVLINSARGAVIDNAALLRVSRERPDLNLVLDVWESEPGIDRELLKQVRLGTPHIAGYSLEGKLRGTAMIYNAACSYFGVVRRETLGSHLPAPQEISIGALSEAENGVNGAAEREKTACKLVQHCYDIEADSNGLKALTESGSEEIATAFDRLRKGYALRREFGSLRLTGYQIDIPLQRTLNALGGGYSSVSESSNSSQAF